MIDKEFKKTVEWNAAHRLCKVYLKKDKNNNSYFMGDYNYNNIITVRKVTGQYAKEGEYEVQIVPVKYQKASSGNYTPEKVVIELERPESQEIPF